MVTGSDGAGSGGDPSTLPSVAGQDAGIKIGSAGGEFTYGPVKLIFPQLSLTVLPVASPSSGNTIRLGDDGRVFDIIVRDYQGNIVSEFDFPIAVCIKPSAAELSDAGGNPHLMSMAHKHAGEDWEALDTYVDGDYVCATVNKLSHFGLSVPLMPNTGFAPGVVTALEDQPAKTMYFNLPIAGANVGRTYREVHSTFALEIPTLDVEMPIMGVPLTTDGWDVSWLGEAAGYLEGTAYPTWAGNTAITAHVWDADNQAGPFVDLHTLQHGDEIIIHAWGQRYIYEVRAITEFRPDDLRALPHSEYDMLTLITCQGFDEASGEYDWRLAVKAVLINIE